MCFLARILALAIILLGSTACLKPNPLVEQLAEEAYGDGDTDADTDTDTDTNTVSGDPPSDMLDPGETSDTGDACEAPPELEPECGICLIQSCCTSLEPCGGDPVCVCLADCLFAGGSENECRTLCDEKPSNVEPLAPLMSCATQDCPDCFTD